MHIGHDIFYFESGIKQVPDKGQNIDHQSSIVETTLKPEPRTQLQSWKYEQTGQTYNHRTKDVLKVTHISSIRQGI